MNQIRRDEGTARLDPSLAAWVDQQCDRFEEAWHTGPRPRIEDYLAGAPEDRALLHELIALEAHYRRLAGEDPQAQDYRQRFPAVETTWLEDAVAARVPALTAPSRVRTKSPWIAGPGERPTVAGYEVLGVLGRGGMGVVYQARDQRLQRLVALKMLLAGAQADSQDLSRFRAEAEAQARLQHPHIVQIHEVGEAAGRPYFALEFVDGGTLAQKLAGKPQPAEAAAQLVETLARAMHYAHQQGVVHRDLKPANVLLTTNDTPKITDFGLAKRLQGTVNQTQSGAVLGTPSYMAPEQASGQPKAIGPATDVYALGTILYEMLTGRPPFLGETTLATVLQVRSLEPVPPQRLQPKVPRDLQTICMKCLQKEPTKRYADAQELADDLRRFLAGESIRARPVGPGERLWRWCRRNPALAVASGLAALALLGVTVLSLAVALYKTQAQERTEAALKQSLRRTTENALEQGILLCKSGEVGSGMLWLVRGLQMPPDGSDDLQRALRANLAGWRRHLHPLRDCLEHPSEVRAIAVSPDGQTIAMASGNNVQLWKDGRPSGKLLRHKNQVRAVAFGPPDGRLILTGSWDGTAQLWDATTGEKKGDQFTHGKRIWSVAFSPDGQKVLTAGDGALVRLWNVARKGEPVSFTGHKLLVQTVAFSRDGKRILTGSRDNTAQLWDVDHPGKPVASLPHEHYVLAAAFSPDGRTVLTGSRDGKATLWDLETHQRRQTLQLNGPVMAVAYRQDGQAFLTGCADGTAQLWDATGNPLGGALHHADWIMAVAFSPDGRIALTGGTDRSVRIWDVAPAADLATPLEGHTDWVVAVAISRDGQFIATGGRDKVARLWDAKGNPLGTPLIYHTMSIPAIAFSPNGRTLVTGSWDSKARLWDVQACLSSRDPARRLRGQPLKHEGAVLAVAFSPDGGTVLTGSEDKTARLWNAETGLALPTLLRLERNVKTVAFHRDGDVFLTGGGGKLVHVWETATGHSVGQAIPHPAAVSSAAFSPDGRLILTGDERGKVRLWDVQTRQPLFSLGTQGGIRTPVAFSPDGRLLLTGNRKTAQLWDRATRKPFGPPLAHPQQVLAAAFSPDGETVLTGCADNKARLWKTLAPAEGTVERLALWVQVLTGMELINQGEIQVSDAGTWHQYRQLLESLGGPPLP